MNRGDIWMIDLGGNIGIRPVVILTRQNVLPYLNKVTITEITSRGKGYPTEVFIGQKANLPKPSFVQTDNIHTIPKDKFIKYIIYWNIRCNGHERNIKKSDNSTGIGRQITNI